MSWALIASCCPAFLAAIGLWCLLDGIRNIRGTATVTPVSPALIRLVTGNIVALIGFVAGEGAFFLLVPGGHPFFGVFAVIFHYGILLSLLMALILFVAWLFHVSRRKEPAP